VCKYKLIFGSRKDKLFFSLFQEVRNA